MLFTEQDLYVNNGLNILNEATYLSEEESLINPITIPVKKVDRLGYGVVRFDDVEKLAEDYGVDYIDAMYAIAESSDMNPEYLAVSVPEEDIIAYPEIVNELANIVIQPLSEYDDEYQYVAECVNVWLESGNDEYLGLLLEMTADQWDNMVKSRSDLTADEKNKIGAMFPENQEYDSKRINKVIRGILRQKIKNENDPQKRAEFRNSRIRLRYGNEGKDKADTIINAFNNANDAERHNTRRQKQLANLRKINRTLSLQHATEKKNTAALEKGITARNHALNDKDKQITSLVAGLNQAAKEGNMSRQEAEKLRQELQASNDRTGRVLQQRDSYMNAFQKADSDLTAERSAHDKTKEQLAQAQKSSEEHEAYKNKGLHRAADKLYSAGNWVKNNKGKTALGVGLGAAAIGGGIYAYKQYKNKPRSVIAKRIAALRSIYKKFMINAQRNPQKANIFKRMAAKILSVIDKLMAFMQNAADGR